ncbi:MAG: phage/plasmid primase, P4 family [Planctomycetota bacterium]
MRLPADFEPSPMRIVGDGEAADSATVRLSEQGNAQLIHQRHGQDIMYVPQSGRWYKWAGTHWSADHRGDVVKFAKEVAVDLESLKREPGVDNTALKKHIVRSQSASGIGGTLKLLQTEPGVPVLLDELDTDPYALNVVNGTIDLRTGHLRKHDRADRITRCLPVHYDPDVQAPRWLKFLREVQPEEHMRTYLQRVVGYAASGTINLQEVWCLWGGGGNGKSIFHDAIVHVLGGYACMAAPSLLVATGRDEHPTELADLHGKRLVVATEIEEDARLKVQLIKRLSGDEKMKARLMRQDYFEFQRTMKTWLVTNNKPRVDEASHAIWRRLRLVPFSVTIPKAQRDLDLLEKLKAEATGILTWIVNGFVDFYRGGIRTPLTVEQATREYRLESDRLADFRGARLATGDGYRVTRADLFAEYVDWAKQAGEHDRLTDRTFYTRVRQIPGVEDARWKDAEGSAVRGFSGIDLAWRRGGTGVH